MPRKASTLTKKSSKKRPPTDWVIHVQNVYADMKKKDSNVTYKEAMCAASNCWNKRTKKQFKCLDEDSCKGDRECDSECVPYPPRPRVIKE
jgi:hypothetical protein